MITRRRMVAWLGLAAAYVAAAEFGFALTFANRQVTAIWPPTGIAVAALMVWGGRVWPGIALGALAVNAIRGSFFPALGIAVGNTLGTLLAWQLLRRLRFDRRLTSTRDVLALAAVALLSMLVTATSG